MPSTTELSLLLAAVPLLVGLLWGEYRESTWRKLASKTPLSALFLVMALVRPHPDPAYFQLVLAGLALGLVGDVCLALPGRVAFKVGAASFLLGHVFYVIAFAHLTPVVDWIGPGIMASIALSAVVWLRLKGSAGDMLPLVTAYVVVITVMLLGALAALRNPALTDPASGVIFLGGVLFYLSDLTVARDRFLKPGFVNRLVGLPLYYAGQFLLAWSVGMVPTAA